MVVTDSLDVVLRRIFESDREECTQQLLQFEGLRLDFTEAYLQSLSLDRLRHVLLAAVLTVQQKQLRAAGA